MKGDIEAKGEVGPHTEQLLIITAEARAWKADLIFGECSHLAGKNLVLDSLGDLYEGMHCVVGPDHFSVPAGRPRSLYALWLKEHEFHGCIEEFLDLFKMSVELEGKDFLVGDESKRLEFAKERAAYRGNYFGDDVTHVPIKDQLTVDGISRLNSHMADINEGCSLTGSYICDLDHRSGYSRGGWLVPPLITHGLLASLNADPAKKDEEVLFLPEEHLIIMGEGIYEDLAGDFPCNFIEYVKEMGRRLKGGNELIHIAGNAMHMHVLGAWIMYGLASLTTKD